MSVGVWYVKMRRGCIRGASGLRNSWPSIVTPWMSTLLGKPSGMPNFPFCTIAKINYIDHARTGKLPSTSHWVCRCPGKHLGLLTHYKRWHLYVATNTNICGGLCNRKCKHLCARTSLAPLPPAKEKKNPPLPSFSPERKKKKKKKKGRLVVKKEF